ncbi:hypothetical protein [Sanguibacter massiliensis]|uniref:hypothetical protein n=1 Tax=Sanguibacter massiliensis TaxID=1973217 RepID=UPI000C8267C3|nr:hypothetical protein [Sanguibacter massiliensis]
MTPLAATTTSLAAAHRGLRDASGMPGRPSHARPAHLRAASTTDPGPTVRTDLPTRRATR